jgi:hypothetical protein
MKLMIKWKSIRTRLVKFELLMLCFKFVFNDVSYDIVEHEVQV